MLAAKKLPDWDSLSTALLKTLFVAVLVLRFLFPFFQNPINSLTIDMERHLSNGYTIFNPTFINGIDPKFYQLWMRLIEYFPKQEQRSFFALTNGLLCAGMMWFWYKALREVTTRRKALGISIILGVHLSFLVIYEYFLIETMVLTSVALFTWMTLRAVRKKTFASFVAAALCGMIAAFTKQTLVPIMVMGLGYALYYQRYKVRAFSAACVIFAAFAIPAGLQSLKVLRVFAPFGFEEMQTLSRKCDSTMFGFRVNDKLSLLDYIFAPEDFYFNPLHPFYKYTTKRSSIPYVINLDLAKGRTDWDHAMEQLEWSHTWSDVLNEYEENFIFLFFTYSYPDSTGPELNTDPFLQDAFSLRSLNFHFRWTWPPCLLLVFLYGPFARMSPGKTWLLTITFVMAWLFLLQDVGIVEGRYRKAIEPFLLVSAFFLLESRRARRDDEEHVSMPRFIASIYIQPLMKQLLAPVLPRRETTQPASAHALPPAPEKPDTQPPVSL